MLRYIVELRGALTFLVGLFAAVEVVHPLPTNAEDRLAKFDPKTAELVTFEQMNSSALAALGAKDVNGVMTDVLDQVIGGRVESAAVDLNGDVVPETIIELIGPLTCGIRDCQMVVLADSPSGLRKLLEVNASSIAIGEKSPDSEWRTIITNPDFQSGLGVIWEGTENGYALK